MANAALNSTSVPLGSGLPASLQGFIDAVAQYVTLSGLDDVAGIVVSQDTPDSSNEDKMWIKTDDAGRPVAAYIFAQYWRVVPSVMQALTTRPTNPLEGTLFFDKTIGVMLRYTGSAWVTADGVSGDLKYVAASSISDALASRPGWVEATGITLGTLPTGVYLIKKS